MRRPPLCALLCGVLLVACSSGGAGDTSGGGGCVNGCATPGFPRVAHYRIEAYIDADAEETLGGSDLRILDAELGAHAPDALERLREAAPGAPLLAYLASEEISRDPDPDEQPLASARFERIPPLFWLLEPGSMLTEEAPAGATTLRVADPSAFSVARPASDFYPADEPTYLLVGAEHVRLVEVEGDTLVVERGFRSTPEAHPAGSPIAAHVVFFSGTWMLDLAASAPSDPKLGTWRDLLAEEAASMVEDGPWSGVFLDVCFSDIGWLNGGLLDVDRDGVADDPKEASIQWTLGMQALAKTLREALGPEVPIMANPGGQDCPHESLDGILLEGWPIGLPPDFVSFDEGFERYLRWSRRPDRRPLTVANAFSEKIGFGMIEPEDDEVARTDYRAMRFGLSITLMGDGYYAFDNGVFGHYVAWRYDEYDGAGRGRGWLGAPRAPYRSLDGGALLREFDGGMAIVNPTQAPLVVTVPDGFAKLSGSQDPIHNDGADVTGTLEVAARDGYVLVRRVPRWSKE